MNNMPPGDNSGAEPRDHERDCLTNCPYISELFVETDTCAAGHVDHICNCDDVERVRFAWEAEAFADWEQAAFAAWERNNG